jgi:hypothetical protein
MKRPQTAAAPKPDTRGGAVRQNFRRGGVPTDPEEAASGMGLWADEEKALKKRQAEQAAQQQAQADAAEQRRYNAMSDQEKRVYQVNYGAGVNGDYTTYQGTNDTIGADLQPTQRSVNDTAALAQSSGVYADSSTGGGGGGGYDPGVSAEASSYDAGSGVVVERQCMPPRAD